MAHSASVNSENHQKNSMHASYVLNVIVLHVIFFFLSRTALCNQLSTYGKNMRPQVLNLRMHVLEPESRFFIYFGE